MTDTSDTMPVPQIPSWKIQVGLFIARHVPTWTRAIVGKALKLTVRAVRTKQMRKKDGTVAYAMLQLWVANNSSTDAEQVRATLHWKRKGGGVLNQHDTPGLWLKKVGTDMAGYSSVDERMDLPSNGEEQHLGLLAKAPGSRDAFIVAPGSYHQGQYPNYQHPAFALPPGDYDLDILFAARGGKKGIIRLEVHQPATGDRSGTLR